MTSQAAIPIIIVGYNNPGDIAACLRALSAALPEPAFDIIICENGGPAAYQNLVCALLDTSGPGVIAERAPAAAAFAVQGFLNLATLRLAGRDSTIMIGQAAENLGYAGGINIWLRVLLDERMWRAAWPGVWILNPDTEPAPAALLEMVTYAALSGKGMIGARIMANGDAGRIHSRGLAWRRMHASTLAVDYHASARYEPDARALEARLDAPSGAAVYVTRACLQSIGLMDERYFLYFEDLDWGLRAKATCGIGYAWRAVIRHRGGTTIGSTASRATRSPLAVYLDFRNRILFVRQWFPGWLPWTVAMLALRALEFAAVGSWRHTQTAYRGLWAGVRGEVGRPGFLDGHDQRRARR